MSFAHRVAGGDDRRVSTFNAVDVVQDGAVGVVKSVGIVPLDIANPQGGFRQLSRVFVNLQAHHLGRVHQRRARRAVKCDLIVDGLPLEVEQRFEGDVEEVAAAAGRIQSFGIGQPEAVGLHDGHCAVGVAGGLSGIGFRFGPLPSRLQVVQNHRLNHAADVRLAGVVRPQRGAFFGKTQRALEQSAEYRRLDVTPVLGCGFRQPFQRAGVQRHIGNVGEQFAVEMLNRLRAEQTAAIHFRKQRMSTLPESLRFPPLLHHQSCERSVVQQAGVLSVQTEYDLVKVLRQFAVPVARTGHVIAHLLEQGSGFLRDVVAAPAGVEPVRIGEHPLDDGESFRFREIGDTYFPLHAFHTGKVRADSDDVERGHHQQGRRFQVHRISEHLAHGAVQLSFMGLEFPPEMIFIVGIGFARFDAMLEAIGQAVELARGFGISDEVTEVIEPGLRALFLV